MKTILLSTMLLAHTFPCQEDQSKSGANNGNFGSVENRTGNAPQGPSFEGILVMQGLGGATTYYIKGDKVRSEMSDEGEEAIFLYSFTGNTYIGLMPSEKVYMEAPVRQINFSDKDVKELTGCESKVTKTEKKETIQDITCKQWVVTCGNDRSEMWVTDELGFELGQIFHPMYRASYDGTMRQFNDMQGYFPMKIITTVGKGKPEVVMEVIRLEKKKLDEELFSVPTGYRNVGR